MIDLLHNQIIKQRSTINFDYFEDIEDTVMENWIELNKENFS